MASYVIVSKGTGKAVFETFHRKIAVRINTAKYEIVPIKEWLIRLNAAIASGKESFPYSKAKGR